MFAVFKTFFLLGCISFGGPAAHIGYFRRAFVSQRRWLSDQQFAQFVALSQFLPGPGSSQLGFAIGYQRRRLPGAIAAFVGFTLPSVLLMLMLAMASHQWQDSHSFVAVVHGLKLLAVVVVADAALGMFNNFCRHRVTASVAILSAAVLLMAPTLATQVLVLLTAALLGARRGRATPAYEAVNGHWRWRPLLLFAALMLLPLALPGQPLAQLFGQFYQAGTLVFGGGHVVLPLLQQLVGDTLSPEQFLGGYAAAQAMPGPMFTLATFLGFQLSPTTPLIGALLATIAIFLPGFLLLLTVLGRWQSLACHPRCAGAIEAVNASVVGILIAALYDPVFVSSVASGQDMAQVLLGLALLRGMKMPIVVLVAGFLLIGVVPTLV
ncbi:chromate efflux transporter [Ferrimonas sp. SCSIO 43195]|uniref:chromate efflux transporter n=1 Tax=Ferrimonas sp. SCSIO 43195 TaxID=2822844 RepID=UPI002075747C|nr:chromate efflux transporter [Ferrimonas sp. SCSIO 43195]USD38902.1 chromate efflux transporter [Ferrimonas sp. SCSIO 43195]